jgi:hypothetical protein
MYQHILSYMNMLEKFMIDEFLVLCHCEAIKCEPVDNSKN